MKALNYLVKTLLAVEKLRVAVTVRLAHLKKNGRVDEDTEIMKERLVDLEEWVTGRVKKLVAQHPAYPWFSRIKGVGQENIAKVIGLVRIKPEKGVDKKGKEVDLKYANTVSGMWQFCGFGVDNETGKAPRRVKGGGPLVYNSELRSMCWRLGTGILKAGLRLQCTKCSATFGLAPWEEENEKKKKVANTCPKCGCPDTPKHTATSKLSQYYLEQKRAYYERYQSAGIRIVPTVELPKDSNKKYYEPDGIISEGHVHKQALRKMIKIFLACLWLEWRRVEGLPVTEPFAKYRLGHTHIIKPEDIIDEPAGW